MPTRLLSFILLLAVPAALAAHRADTAPATRLEGAWVSGCVPMGKNGRHGTIARLTITGDHIDAVAQTYAHATCDMPTVRTHFSARLLDMSKTGNRIDATMVVDAVTLTPQQPDVVHIYNDDREAKGCGTEPWRLGEAQSIAGTTCAGRPFPERGARLSWHIRREGSHLHVPSPIAGSTAGGNKDVIVFTPASAQ